MENLSEEMIEAGIELCSKATPGPWQTNAVPSLGSTANGVFTKPPGDEEPELFVCSVKPRWEEGCIVGDEAIANAEFIAAARTLLPAALRELQSLRTRLAALEGKWQPISTAPTDGTEFLGYWDNDDMHVVCIRNGECYRAMDREPWAMPLCWMPLPEAPSADALKAELEKSE